jgi:hypothetical protein
MTVTQATKGLTMLTPANLATIQSALDTLATITRDNRAWKTEPVAALLRSLAIKSYYCSSARPAYYHAACDIVGLDVTATGKTRLAALRGLFKALHNCTILNEQTITVPLALREPTKAQAQARAKRKADLAEIERVRARCAAVRAEREAKWHAELDRAATAVEAERAAAPNIIGPAPELRAVDSHDDSLQVQVGGYSRIVCNNLAPRFVEAPIIPAAAEAGTEGIFKALLGLTTEQKIVALANALRAAQTTIYRVEEDGAPIIRAILPNYHPHLGTCTVLNL